MALENLHRWFWDERKWLPEGFHWEDLKSTNTVRRPQAEDIRMAPILAIGLLIFRYVFERFIAIKLFVKLGILSSKNELVSNLICEDVYTSSSSPDQDKIRQIMAQTGWTYQVVVKWFRRRKKLKTPPALLKKASESCWRCFIYFVLFVYGGYVLVGEHWFWDTNQVMSGFIRSQQLPEGIKWYYLAELSLYLQLCITQMFDTKRKDFWQQYLHHLITVLLISGSYICGHFRFGALIMFVHDASDFWLESAKVTNYAKLKKRSELFFVVFAVTFYLTRWVYFPFWILLTFMRENSRLCGPLTSYLSFPYLMLYLCFILLALHIYWGLLIARMVYKFTVAGEIEKDERSDSEESDNDDSDVDGNGSD